MAPAPGRPLPAGVPGAPRAAFHARAHRNSRARRTGDPPADRLLRPRRRDRLLGHPPAARRDGPRPRLRQGRRPAHRQRDLEHARRRSPRHASGGGDDVGDTGGDPHRAARARGARRAGDRLRRRALHARELRDRGRHVEGLHEDEGLHALGARCLEASAREARHRAGRLPARTGGRGGARAAGVRFVGRPRARPRGLPPLRRAAQPRAVRKGRGRGRAGRSTSRWG